MNVEGQDWFVGDLHGEYALLMQNLARVGFDTARDRLFAVGDLIDRGPDSRRCLELLQEDWFYSTLGNHEQALLMGLNDESVRARHRSIGGGWLQTLPRSDMEALAALIEAKMSLAITVETPHGQVGVIHAEAPGDWSVLNSPLEDWNNPLWSVNAYNRALSRRARAVSNIDIVVAGHVGALYVEIGENQMWLDTLMQSGKLSLLSADQLFQHLRNG
ncbi:MAG: protein phosphatase [Oceanospirillales bacterium]|nr:protein phosphatase [Oceanospirillales bacterium]